jgi:NAD(P)-dependent dehydrogenase (short-subunit alcohol dehydrogenase family)
MREKREEDETGLSEKVAIVTGGASGMGREISQQLARCGCTVVVADRNRPGAAEVANDLLRNGCRAVVCEVDVAQFAEVQAAVGHVLDEFGTVDILVNCAGFNILRRPEEITIEQWREILSINLDGPWHFCSSVIPEMIKKRWGRIVNIASGAGILGIPTAAHYTAAKHGVVGLTRALALDLAEYGVTVNCVCPGPVLTPLLEQATTPSFIAGVKAETPTGRLGTPRDIASAVLFFVSQEAAWVTGSVLPVDGGTSAGLYRRNWQ